MTTNAITNPTDDPRVFLIKGARLLFENAIFKGYPKSNGEKTDFDMIFILKKEKGDITTLVEQAKLLSEEKFEKKKGYETYTFLHTLDGDQQKSTDGTPSDRPFAAARGHWIFRCKATVESKEKPVLPPLYSPSNKNLVDKVKTGEIPMSFLRQKFYSGCFVDLLVEVNAYAYKFGSKSGNACRLRARSIRWVGEGKRLSVATIASLAAPEDEKDDPFVCVSVDKAVEEAQEKVDNTENVYGDIPF